MPKLFGVEYEIVNPCGIRYVRFRNTGVHLARGEPAQQIKRIVSKMIRQNMKDYKSKFFVVKLIFDNSQPDRYRELNYLVKYNKTGETFWVRAWKPKERIKRFDYDIVDVW